MFILKKWQTVKQKFAQKHEEFHFKIFKKKNKKNIYSQTPYLNLRNHTPTTESRIWEFNFYTSIIHGRETKPTHTHKRLRHFTYSTLIPFFCDFFGKWKKTIVWKPTPGHLTPYCKHQTSQKNISDSNELELISPRKDTCNLSHSLTFKGIFIFIWHQPKQYIFKTEIMPNH